MSNDYICNECKGSFLKAWSDEEAKAEAISIFGYVGEALVCDDCFNKIMARNAKQIYATED